MPNPRRGRSSLSASSNAMRLSSSPRDFQSTVSMSRPNASSMVSQAARVGAMTIMRPRGPPARRNASRSGGRYASRTGRCRMESPTTGAPWTASSRNLQSGDAGRSAVARATHDRGTHSNLHQCAPPDQTPRHRWSGADATPSGNPLAPAAAPASRHPSKFGTCQQGASYASAPTQKSSVGRPDYSVPRPLQGLPSKRRGKTGYALHSQYRGTSEKFYPSSAVVVPVTVNALH